ncbi:MAG TPA: aldehyde dehydrogenase family protein, partial [Solirubrobacteraceae bacterium]|nr:aldehyde dehydrogenase family protein [Solirubrobacteraceae bacterium]
MSESAEDAVSGVEAVVALWAQLRVADRARYLDRAAQAVIDEFDGLREEIAAEAGRPAVEVAAFELLAAIDTLQWLARNARELLSAKPLLMPRAIHPLKRASAGHSPLGVVAVIGAGSSPFAGLLARAGAALLAGNGVVIKPAARSARAGERVAGVLARAGLPEGIVRVIQGDGRLGAELAGCAGVAHVSFSGSRRRGAQVAAAAAARGASSSLDLAAGEAMIVLADASLDAAVAGATWAACAGAGQLHGSLQRVYVEPELHDAFAERFAAACAGLTMGAPADPATELGPLVSAERRALLEAAVADCVAGGATLLARATPPAGELPFCAPSVLCGGAAALAPLREFVPGPVAGVSAVRDSVEAVALENEAAPGARGASIWSADRRRAARIARELRAPVVWCNDHLVGPLLPRDAADTVAACVSPKLITWDPSGTRLPWRFPYDATSAGALRAL